MEEVRYCVCGFSKKHGYYRTKVGTFETEQEALDVLKQYRERNDWRISTIIVKQIFMNGYKEYTSADKQQRIWACSCKDSKAKIYPKYRDFGQFTY